MTYRDDHAASQARTDALESRVRELEAVLHAKDHELRTLRRRELRAPPADVRGPLRWSSVEVLLRASNRRKWYPAIILTATVMFTYFTVDTRLGLAPLFLGLAATALSVNLVVFRCPACRKALPNAGFFLFKKTHECPLCHVKFEE